MTQLDSTYDPKAYETTLYDFWTKKGYFKASRTSSKKPYTILMPPPNVTASLHMGHGTGSTMQDILVRWKRMCGYEALWLPGTDHAGIATQMMVEKDLEKQGLSRKELGREAFEKRLWEWKDKYGGLIIDQFRAMGFSCDWDRLAFTMDPQLSKAVREIFVQLYNEGLIYRGERLVNWDPVLRTAISDDEIENKELHGSLWHIRYPVEGSEEFITIATTRPETMLGDTAVAVHPDDERYQHLIGKQVRLPLTDRLIPIIADEYVKSEFGTGCVKITPAHDANDFEIGKRHNLPFINIMNEDATLNDQVPEAYRGLDRFVARKEVLKALKQLELFDKEENHKNIVPHSERSKAVIEPRLSLQWYVRMSELAKPAIRAAETGDLKFHPDLWKKTYLHWLENIQDWCISRQLWWGHRIPIWYCDDCEKTSTGVTDPTACSHCGSKHIHQDEDVLDTWFSSWLWPLSPFGWPDESQDLEHFYPSQVLVTAPEIIFLWVARMVMVGLKVRGKVPFHDVLLTATVCDKQGKKFSKTLGNGIDPLDMIDKHGTDAVRFTGVYLAPLGGRIRMAPEDFDMGAKFVNKIWNAARFLLGYVNTDQKLSPLSSLELDLSEMWLINEFRQTTEAVNKALASYRINDAVSAIYHYIWGGFCDWGIETAKPALSGSDQELKQKSLSVLVYILDGILRLASPVMPFVTEEIWQKLPSHPDWERAESLVIATYPQVDCIPSYPEEAAAWNRVQEAITAVRSIRMQAGVPPKQTVDVTIKSDKDLLHIFEASSDEMIRLARIGTLQFASDRETMPQSLLSVGRGFEVYIPAAGLLDLEKEKTRLNSEIKRIQKIVAGLNGKLANKNFVDRAPEEVITQTKEQLENMQMQLSSLEKNLKALQ